MCLVTVYRARIRGTREVPSVMRRLARIRTILSLAIGVAGLVFSAAAQKGGGGAPPTAPGNTDPGATPVPGGGRGNTPRSPFPDPNNPNNNTNRFPEMQQRPIFLSGKVMLDDGTPPPEPVTIERVCNGNPRAEAYTD